MIWVQEEYGIMWNHGWMLQLWHWAELIALRLHNVCFFSMNSSNSRPVR